MRYTWYSRRSIYSSTRRETIPPQSSVEFVVNRVEATDGKIYNVLIPCADPWTRHNTTVTVPVTQETKYNMQDIETWDALSIDYIITWIVPNRNTIPWNTFMHYSIVYIITWNVPLRLDCNRNTIPCKFTNQLSLRYTVSQMNRSDVTPMKMHKSGFRKLVSTRRCSNHERWM